MTDRADDAAIEAGEFGAWLKAMRNALRGEGGMDVPCGDCRGCCISGYSIQVRPGDLAAKARIPDRFLVVRGATAVMRPQPGGRCPMAIAEGCAIYAHRPQTCLDYDCRIFAAAGIEAGDASKSVINTRVRAWRFSYADQAARREHEAVAAAAAFMRAHPEAFPEGRTPLNPMSVAVFAVKAYALFLEPGAGQLPPRQLADAVMQAARDFDQAPIPASAPRSTPAPLH